MQSYHDEGGVPSTSIPPARRDSHGSVQSELDEEAPPPEQRSNGKHVAFPTSDEQPLLDVASNRTFVSRAFSSLTPGSLRGSILALSASAIGAGMLSLPLVLYDCGLILGLLLLLIGALLALFSIEILVACGSETNIKTYSGLVAHVYGNRWAQILEAIIVFYAFGACVAYLIVIGKSTHSVFSTLPISSSNVLNDQNVVLSIVTAAICFPLSLLRNLSSLRYASIFSILSMLYVSVAIFVRSFDLADTTNMAYFKPTWRIFQSITVTFFAYTCHINVFSIYSELKNPLVRRMNKVTRRAVSLEVLLYGLIAVTGFLSWQNPYSSQRNGADFQGNVLDAYSDNDKLILAGRVCVSIALTIALPLNIHPCRLNLENLAFHGKEFSWVRHVVLTVLLIGPALGLAIAIPQVNVVFGLLGATCCVVFCYMLPIMLYVNIHYGQLTRAKRYGLYGMMAVIMLIGLISVGESIYDFTQ